VAQSWRNWSGSIAFRPQRIACPRDGDALAQTVCEVVNRGGMLRVIGSGHSSSDIVHCDDTLVSLRHLRGIVSVDRAACEATVRAGSTLDDLGSELYEHDLALPNHGDVATQTIDGAIGTGTHGTGHGCRIYRRCCWR
jgi:FAD/FMN-containing dehydrogenase